MMTSETQESTKPAQETAGPIVTRKAFVVYIDESDGWSVETDLTREVLAREEVTSNDVYLAGACLQKVMLVMEVSGYLAAQQQERAMQVFEHLKQRESGLVVASQQQASEAARVAQHPLFRKGG